MDELEELRRQLTESVEDGDFISPDKARRMLALLESAVKRYEDFDSHEEFLHPSEEVAYEAHALCDASTPHAPPALANLLRRLSGDDAAGLRRAIREFGDAVDQIKFLEGPGAAPDVLMSLPGVNGMLFWIRLRQVVRMLEGKDA